MRKKSYLTTTLPYVNAAPHIGFALELVQADAAARYLRHEECEVFLNTGTDEHGVKIYRNAVAEGKDPQTYVDENAAHFKKLLTALNIDLQSGRFIRTTDPAHAAAAQEFWRRCDAAGDIYKAKYRVKYCSGCELEKTDSELENGHCPLHPALAIEEREEENYFFKFSRYQERLLELYAKYQDFVLPEFRLNEIRRFVEGGLSDFSISRLKEKMPWGVSVPEDEGHVMYVWFDALVNYVSTLGWPASAENSTDKPSDFEKFWGTKEEPNAIQFAGKDNLRQQSAMWQAMLMSAGLPPSRQIVIHGFITVSGGEKMSKSAGNVVDPFEIVARYGADALRYWLLREVPTFEDGDFTRERFEESYNANLANGLGNLVSRVGKMARAYGVTLERARANGAVLELYRETMERFEFQKAMDAVWERIQASDRYVQETEPFKTIKTDPERAKRDVANLLRDVREIGELLAPFLPETSGKILAIAGDTTAEFPPLFPRIE